MNHNVSRVKVATRQFVIRPRTENEKVLQKHVAQVCLSILCFWKTQQFAVSFILALVANG